MTADAALTKDRVAVVALIVDIVDAEIILADKSSSYSIAFHYSFLVNNR